MLSFLQKSLKSSIKFIYIVFNTQSKRVLKKNQEFAAPKDIRFGAKFFVRSRGSRYLREMKTSTNDEN